MAIIMTLCLSLSLNIFILHRLRNKFLQLILISLDSAMTLWIGSDAVLKSSSQWQFKRILKINNSWTELFNFQNSCNC